MRISFEPISSIPAPLLIQHLLEYGLPAEIIEWKYFDKGFRPEGERGFVWLKEGRVRGIVGLIPYNLGCTTELRGGAWSCDWFVSGNPGVGPLLLQYAAAQCGILTTTGGNEATKRMVPRIAARTVTHASTQWVRPLRVGGLRNFRRAANRLPGWSWGWLEGVGIKGVPYRAAASARSEAGVSRHALEPVLARRPDEGWAPHYDLDYVDWQLGRCPAVEALTVSSLDPEAATGAVTWRARSGKEWRLVLWAHADRGAARAVLAEALRQADVAGGHLMSAIVAETDVRLQTLLAEAGFAPTDLVFPLYVLAGPTASPVDGLSQLGYLDSDLAYRF